MSSVLHYGTAPYSEVLVLPGSDSDVISFKIEVEFCTNM
jgi:hypothetical protein